MVSGSYHKTISDHKQLAHQPYQRHTTSNCKQNQYRSLHLGDLVTTEKSSAVIPIATTRDAAAALFAVAGSGLRVLAAVACEWGWPLF